MELVPKSEQSPSQLEPMRMIIPLSYALLQLHSMKQTLFLRQKVMGAGRFSLKVKVKMNYGSMLKWVERIQGNNL